MKTRKTKPKFRFKIEKKPEGSSEECPDFSLMEILPSGEKSARLFADDAYTFYRYAEAMARAYQEYTIEETGPKEKRK